MALAGCWGWFGGWDGSGGGGWDGGRAGGLSSVMAAAMSPETWESTNSIGKSAVGVNTKVVYTILKYKGCRVSNCHSHKSTRRS